MAFDPLDISSSRRHLVVIDADSFTSVIGAVHELGIRPGTPYDSTWIDMVASPEDDWDIKWNSVSGNHDVFVPYRHRLRY